MTSCLLSCLSSPCCERVSPILIFHRWYASYIGFTMSWATLSHSVHGCSVNPTRPLIQLLCRGSLDARGSSFSTCESLAVPWLRLQLQPLFPSCSGLEGLRPSRTPLFLHGIHIAQLVTVNASSTTTIIHSILTGEEPPPHSGELKHALSQAGGPTQSQLSRPMSSGHHISVEHRLRRKQLNTDTSASNKTYLKELQEKKEKKKLFSSEKKKITEHEKH